MHKSTYESMHMSKKWKTTQIAFALGNGNLKPVQELVLLPNYTCSAVFTANFKKAACSPHVFSVLQSVLCQVIPHIAHAHITC